MWAHTVILSKCGHIQQRSAFLHVVLKILRAITQCVKKNEGQQENHGTLKLSDNTPSEKSDKSLFPGSMLDKARYVKKGDIKHISTFQ